MDGILIRERYKVIDVLWQSQDYAAVEAVDIQDRETPCCLINLYGGALLHRYGEICSRMQDCPEFLGMFLEGGVLAVLFRTSRGQPIDQLFFRGDKWSWTERLACAQLLMHKALTMANLPPEISCAVFLSDNLLLSPNNNEVDPRFMLRPMEEMTPRELPLLAADQLKKLLPAKFSSCDSQRKMLEQLDQLQFASIVPMYSWWNGMLKEMRTEIEELEQKNPLTRFGKSLWRAIKRVFRRGTRG